MEQFPFICKDPFICSFSLSNFLYMGPSIKYVRKIFRKTNISDPLIRTLFDKIALKASTSI